MFVVPNSVRKDSISFEIAPNNVTVMWAAPAGVVNDGYSVEIKYNETERKTPQNIANPLKATFTDLIPGTWYTVILISKSFGKTSTPTVKDVYTTEIGNYVQSLIKWFREDLIVCCKISKINEVEIDIKMF